ncbi:MAG: thioredoxin-disulfide reductase [bacterium]|nr:thioredoxin-disulfide reductase [bacterium]
MTYDVIILGGGPAGLTAGIYLSRGGKKTLLLEGIEGGEAARIEKVENYPGFPEGISGSDLVARIREQARAFGTEIRSEEAAALEAVGEEKRVRVETEVLVSRSVIIAIGTHPRRLQVPGEKELFGRGVSYCATCDGPLFRGKPVAVVGGGNSAVHEALHLAGLASRVYLIHRRDRLRAEHVAGERARSHPRVEIVWDSIPQRFLGDESLSGIEILNKKTGAVSVIEAAAVFVSIGAHPRTEFLRGVLDLDPEGFIVTGENLQTSMPGVFAAGDVRVQDFRQIVTAVAEGARAAQAAENYCGVMSPPRRR